MWIMLTNLWGKAESRHDGSSPGYQIRLRPKSEGTVEDDNPARPHVCYAILPEFLEFWYTHSCRKDIINRILVLTFFGCGERRVAGHSAFGMVWGWDATARRRAM